MNIKILLIGSAASFVAVTGASAADAVVVAEPEPVEYVRVCDVYGTGFYYIPGTETCLSVGGYIRLDVRAGEAPIAFSDVRDKKDFINGVVDTNDTYDIRARARINFDARSETELGTLRGFAALEFNFRNGVDANRFTFNGRQNTNLQSGYIELGGLRVGKTDSLFSSFTNYAGNVILDDTAVPYGPFDTHQIIYTFDAGSGFTIAAGVEDGGASGNVSPFVGAGAPTDFTIDSYVPDVVAGVKYAAAWGGISVVGGYDSVMEEGAVKARLDIKATSQLSFFIMGGYSTNDVPIRGAANNFYASWGGDYGVWGGGSFKLNDKVKINAQISYDEDEDFGAVANFEYTPVAGFKIEPEIIYKDNFGVDNSDSFGGVLRFQRNF